MKSPKIPVKIPALEVTGKTGEFQFPAAPIRRWNWKNSPTGRIARILARKRQYGQRPLTFIEIARILSNVRFIDLTGRQFGLLTVESYQGTRRSTKGRCLTYRVWRCRCSCGGMITTRTSSLLSGHAKSCGCSRRGKRFLDLTSRKFGLLTVVGYSGIGVDDNGKRTRRWRCRCDCGEFIITRAQSLLAGKSISCGHIRRDKARARFRALHFIEKKMGKDAIAGIEQLSAFTHGDAIWSTALSAAKQMNGANE